MGTIRPAYIGTGQTTQDCGAYPTALGDGYASLDFMWPIVFNAKP
ncbi:hypothetical protein [Palleronia pontilimi]|nr:hypothetical protein [Palleronia pontilimi]